MEVDQMMEIVQDETFKTKQDIQNYFSQLKKQVKRFTDDIFYVGVCSWRRGRMNFSLI